MIIIDTAMNTFKNVLTALALAPFLTFVFLAYFQPEFLDQNMPIASAHIREAINMIVNFITSIPSKIV